MVRIRIEPSEVHDALAASEEMRRLVAGDALDRAMYGSALLTMVMRDAAAMGATSVQLIVEGAGDVHQQMADANGFTLEREILQLRRDLPLDEPWSLAVRPFEVGRDDAAWIECNNRAFAWHPDQRDFTLAALQTKQAEPWFDPAGFLLHERDGRLAGFCWTKVHADERPPLGEIFVIGVDPDFQGQGLGRQLVLAGLDWLAGQGLRNGILYTESSNVSALALYAKLGFETNAVNRWWRATPDPAAASTAPPRPD